MFILVTGITTAVINIMPLIQFMALIQCNITLDINYASKQKTCIVQSVLLIFVFWQYGCDPW